MNSLRITLITVFLIWRGNNVKLFAQTPNPILIGVVTKLNSHHTPVYPVQVICDPANPKRTDIRGIFELEFFNLAPGSPVKLHLTYENWVVVNDDDRSTKISNAPLKDTLKLYMCTPEVLDSTRLNYYHVSINNLRKVREAKIAQLNKKSKDYEEKLELLENEFEKLKKQADVYSRIYSRINFDDISEIENKAFEYFLKGDIERAIKIFESINSDKIINLAQNEIKQSSEIIKEQNERIKNAKEEIGKQVQKLLIQGDFYTMNFQWDKANIVYKQAVLADSTNFSASLRYYRYLRLQNRLEEFNRWWALAFSDAVTAKDSVVALSDLGEYHQELNNLDTALKYYIESYKIFRRIEKDSSEEYQYLYASLFNNLGTLFLDKKNYSEAKYFFNMSIQIRLKILENNPNYEQNESELSLNYMDLGALYRKMDSLDQSERAYATALAISYHLMQIDTSLYKNNLALIYLGLGTLYIARDNLPAAEEAYDKALSLRELLAKINPNTYNPYLAKIYSAISFLYFRQNKFDSAVNALEKSLKIRIDLYKLEPKANIFELIDNYSDLGTMYYYKNDFLTAKKYFGKALELCDSDAVEFKEKILEINQIMSKVH